VVADSVKNKCVWAQDRIAAGVWVPNQAREAVAAQSVVMASAAEGPAS